MGDQPGRVRENSFAVDQLERLLNRVIPEFHPLRPLEPAPEHVLIPSASGRRQEIIERGMMVLVAVRKRNGGKRSSPSSKRLTKVVHMVRKQLNFLSGLFPLRAISVPEDPQRFPVEKIFIRRIHDGRIVLPVGVFEFFPDLPPFGDELAPGYVVLVVIDFY